MSSPDDLLVRINQLEASTTDLRKRVAQEGSQDLLPHILELELALAALRKEHERLRNAKQ